MDSGNSGGSLQSSSGGDDEFDSRGGGGVDSSPLSALLRPSSSGAFSLHGSMYGFQELGSVGTSLTQQQQQGVPWSAAQFAAGVPSSSSPRVPQGADTGMGAGAHQQGDPSSAATEAAAAVAAPSRGSRKRTRASRRAPTTVLTTDTSNFRAMVQEFTGIPSPPFVAGVGGPAASLRTRFDHLFPSPASTLRSAADPASSLPPYLLRPFAQKLPTAASPFPPFTSSSSSSTSTPSSSTIGVANANAITTGTAAATTATSVNPTAAGAGDTFQLTPTALLRMQQDATSSSYLSFPNVLASSQPMFGGFARLHDTSPSPSFSDFLGSVSAGGSISLTDGGGLMSSDTLHHLPPRNDAHHGGDELSGVVASGSGGGGYGSCKLNYAPHAGASSSQATASADKPPDAAAAARPARGEGLDPWICTSE
ncbi:hypothetical protein E2562_020353 [Oryza meyeriana var. granulata]|uniref:VQ domain-containing protein n=1 Tax=Oryza meyeriana var. granulata TaxID=110450 RepID=A0A6G1DL26_9ORYZ|nr:hypothetical protein E2562_020353 [Oryza meyeriana var. granulata]